MATRNLAVEETDASVMLYAADAADASDAATPSGQRDPRVDAYLANAAPFARPILAHLRHIVHTACPEVEETVKWGMPFFVHRGGNLCHMAAFKAHCAFGFWRDKEIPDLPTPAGASSMGSFGRILSVDDLPSRRRLTGFVRTAMTLNETRQKPARAKSTRPKPVPAMPDDLADAFAANVEAARHFAAFSPSCRREYLEWILEARRPETRTARIAKIVESCVEGRTRYWRYQK